MDVQNKSSILPPRSASVPRVAFDTSVLGYAQYGAAGRTGVFRMVDSLARGLAASSGCELAFCGAENFRMWTSAREYLRREPELSRVPVISYRSPARVYRFLGKHFWELVESERTTWSRRAFRRSLQEVLRAVESRYSPLEERDLHGMDVFHSSFFGLPAASRGVAGLRRFLTICDLINIQYPQHSVDGGAFLRSILSTVQPSDWVIAISESTKQAVCEVRPDLDPHRVSVVPLAASGRFHRVDNDETIRATKRRLGLSDRNYFLSVCTLDPRKNLEGLVRAFSACVRGQGISDTDLVLCGALGHSTVRLTALISKESLEGRVHLTGYVSDEDLAPLYSGALGFAYVSFHEGFGLPILEAMQCGVPVVASSCSALAEVGGSAARFVDPKSVDDIASGLHDVYRSSELRIALARAGLDRARSFSWENSVHLLLEAYKAAL